MNDISMDISMNKWHVLIWQRAFGAGIYGKECRILFDQSVEAGRVVLVIVALHCFILSYSTLW